MKRTIILGLVTLAALGGTALAYPQFELSKDQSCTGCHLSPAGSGLLSENGFNVAETTSMWGTAPEFFYNKLKPPSWLTLGGDSRGAYGYIRTPQQYIVAFPMQLDLYANAKFADHFHVQVTAGYRTPEVGNEAATHVWSREHYVMWQQHPDETTGLYFRVGRFMPVFGLRLAEHPAYVRRYGGTPLYSETYGASVSYINEKFDVHASGFIRDPVIDPVAHDNGGAMLAEVRLGEHASIGVEGMATRSPDDRKYRGGGLAKVFVAPADMMLMAEFQVINQHVDAFGLVAIVGYLGITKFLPGGLMADLGINHYDENIRIKGLDRDALDLNIHWFATSHIEGILTSRLELINQNRTLSNNVDGPTGGYVLLQAHYRL